MRLKMGLWSLGWLGVGLCLLACVPQPQPVPTVSASANVHPTASPLQPLATPTPSPMLEKRADGRMCEPVDVSKITPSLKYPIDLAVSPDGQDIYIVTKHCQDDVSQKPGLNTFVFSDCGSKPDSGNVIPRSYIYHFRPGQGLEILKINNQPPLSCELGEDIEMDSQGRLYVTTPYNHRIYRIDPKQNKMEQMVEARQEKLVIDTAAPPGHLLSGPVNLYLDKDQVYFALYEASPNLAIEQYIAQIAPNQRQNIIFRNLWASEGYTLFMVADASFGTVRQQIFTYISKQVFVFGPPYPSPEKSSSFSIGMIVFDPFSPVGETGPYPKKANAILGDMKIDAKYDIFGQDMNIFATHPSWHRILHLPNSESVDYARNENRLYVFAGSGEPGFKDGHFQDAQFRLPAGLTLDANHNLFVADMGNHAIRKVTRAGDVTTQYIDQH